MDLTVGWIRDNVTLIEEIPQKIPNKLHMIWIGEKQVPDDVSNYLIAWKNLMPEWTVMLWTNEYLNENYFSKEVLDKVNQAEKAAQKADILRYFIIKQYGGFYVDTDVVPHRSLECLRDLGHDLILYHDNDLTWEYIINCFFGAIPNHPVLQKACEMVLNAELNTSDINFKTGPYLLGRAVATTSTKKRYGLLKYNFFDHKQYFEGKFGTHLYAKSWWT